MTTFSVQSLLYALKTVNSARVSTLISQNLGFKLEQGTFLRFLILLDTPSLSDSEVRSFFKTLTDNPVAADAAAKTFQAVRSDNTATTDEKVLAVFKVLVDTAAVTDLTAHSLTRPTANSAGVTDARTATFNKIAAETINVTDDVDGAASIQDDQEVHFVKTRTDAAAVADVFTRILTAVRALGDTTSTTDTGSLRSQSFSDFTYFSEDFVGVSRTFT